MIVRKTDWQLKDDESTKNSPAFKNRPELYDKIYFVDVDKLNEQRKNTQDKWEFYLDYKYGYHCDSHK